MIIVNAKKPINNFIATKMNSLFNFNIDNQCFSMTCLTAEALCKAGAGSLVDDFNTHNLG